MTLFLYVLLLASLVAFAAASALRAVRYARAPIHLRWEIYPVPEGHTAQIRKMIPEILLLKGLWEFNRAMWLRSYLFHLGLYFTIAALFCLAGAAAVDWVIFEYGFSMLAPAGAILGIAGAVALLQARLTDAGLRPYSTAGDIFNLVFFIATFATLLAGYDPVQAIFFVRALAAFDTNLPVSPVFAAGVVLGSLLMAYIPLTHMAHFIGKYFTWHAVRWDDRGPTREVNRRIAEYLTYRPTWSAPHVGADGQRTWGEIATTNPTTRRPK